MSRKIVAGIDEAGLGPKLGPLIVSLCSFESKTDALDLSLFTVLSDVIARKGKLVDRRVRVDDSKLVYQGVSGFAHIEKTALSFWCALYDHPPRNLGEWIEVNASMKQPDLDECPWYGDNPCNLNLPVQVNPELIKECGSAIRNEMNEKGISPFLFSQDIVTAPIFNRRIEKLGCKSAALSTSVLELISRTVRNSDKETCFEITVDKLGSRAYYTEMLLSIFPFKKIEIHAEGPEKSVYSLTDDNSEIKIGFYRKGDRLHFQIALASIFSKYTRELFMRLFNSFWKKQQSGLKPTAGYPVDAERFISEIRLNALSLGLDLNSFIRIR